MPAETFSDAEQPRDSKLAIKRGLRLKCPRCGEGALFYRYLKVQPECPCCGLDLTPQRADDGPAYLVILVVCHLAGFMMAILWESFRMEPIVMASLMSVFVTVVALALLPSAKGLFVAVQWANRMHGFGRRDA
ncbi:DUF983 domain-containing protein [Phaeovulum sp. W22_SRMD_FR3]|uniref:DUF983 domain-containing protein n=1 Tax=Phaeovulum sp. W22_SRMD_FR3 TaxID=3240274 RepID=UPI003F967CA4